MQCDICKSDRLQFFSKVKDFLVSHEDFVLQECLDCATLITTPRPDSSKLADYYQSADYMPHKDESESLFDRVYNLAQNYMLNWKYKRIKRTDFLKDDKSVLDIGCGTGAFLQKMKDKGWKVQGVEPSQNARKIANANDLNVIETNEFFDLTSKYNLISLWHVLEHLEDPHKYFQKIESLLSDSGCLLIAVPNYLSYDAQSYSSDWGAYDVPRHLYHFSIQSIETLSEKHGFKVDKILSLPLDSFYVSLLSEQNKQAGFLLRGIWIGLISFLQSKFYKRSASSLLYVLKKDSA